MSSRTTLRPYSVITNGNMAADITSEPTILQSLSGVAYSYSWSGTSPVGEISVQVSNDYALNPDGSVKNAGTWTAIEFSLNGIVVDSAPITGNAGSGVIDIQRINAYAIRTFYDVDSGVGTLNVIVSGKVN